MNPDWSQLKWGRIAIGVLAAVLGGMLAITLIIALYAFTLGFEARGAPDQASIEAFANRVAPIGGPLAAAILTFLAAAWVSRRATGQWRLHGIVTGLLVAGVGLAIGWELSLASILGAALAVATGYLGAVAGRPRASAAGA